MVLMSIRDSHVTQRRLWATEQDLVAVCPASVGALLRIQESVAIPTPTFWCQVEWVSLALGDPGLTFPTGRAERAIIDRSTDC